MESLGVDVIRCELRGRLGDGLSSVRVSREWHTPCSTSGISVSTAQFLHHLLGFSNVCGLIPLCGLYFMKIEITAFSSRVMWGIKWREDVWLGWPQGAFKLRHKEPFPR